jgi:hypothetical protein
LAKDQRDKFDIIWLGVYALRAPNGERGNVSCTSQQDISNHDNVTYHRWFQYGFNSIIFDKFSVQLPLEPSGRSVMPIPFLPGRGGTSGRSGQFTRFMTAAKDLLPIGTPVVGIGLIVACPFSVGSRLGSDVGAVDALDEEASTSVGSTAVVLQIEEVIALVGASVGGFAASVAISIPLCIDGLRVGDLFVGRFARFSSFRVAGIDVVELVGCVAFGNFF